MFRDRLNIILVMSAVLICSSTASAQLFGDRDISRNRKKKSLDDAAAVTGTEEFVRGNRAADDFVGANATGPTTFVGTSQAPPPTAVSSSVAGLTEEAAPQVNVPRTRQTAGIYPERLSIAFEPRADGGYRVPPKTGLSKSLSQIAEDRGVSMILSPSDSTVRLRGTVSSPQQKRIAELLALFEPGIETVENELRVEPKASH